MSLQNRQTGVSGILTFLGLCVVAFSIGFSVIRITNFGSTDLRSRASTQIASSYDVIVVGAGTGGIGAALQAARMGKSVLLLEETDYIGGQMTAAGVSTIDISQPQWGTGIYAEFAQAVKQFYQSRGIKTNTCYWSGVQGYWSYDEQQLCFEPQVGRSILESMITKEKTLTLALKTTVQSLRFTAGTVTGVTLQTGKTVYSHTVIDATEFGDLIPLASIPYRIGNIVSSELAPNSQACVQDITYVGILKQYPHGLPQQLKITSPPPGYTPQLLTYFSNVLINGSNPIPTTPNTQQTWEVFLGYRGLPNSANPSSNNTITKTGINYVNDFPGKTTSGMPVLSQRYLSDPSYRKEMNCQAKLKTIQLLYFIQHDLGKSDWSISTDEQYDTAYAREHACTDIIPDSLRDIEMNLAVLPYVRESRRGIGKMTFTAKDMKRSVAPFVPAKQYSSSIAIGEYATDIHNCSSENTLETQLESPNDMIGYNMGPFEIPFETLIPYDSAGKPLRGFVLAEKNISQSRLANGATRLQPVTMAVGQAAGAIAAIAATKNISSADVVVADVQSALLKQKSVLIPFSDVSTSTPAFYDIQNMALKGIMKGYGDLTFHPNESIHRSTMAVILTRLFPIAVPSSATGLFSDVPVSSEFAPYIEALATSSITKGCTATTFCPDGTVTNAQLASFLARGREKYGAAFAVPKQTHYADVPTTHWAYRPIEQLAQAGVIWSCRSSGEFCPDEPVLRGTTATVISKFLSIQ